MVTVGWKDCCLVKYHVKLPFLHSPLCLRWLKQFLYNVFTGWKPDFTVYFLRLLHFFIIILFCPLPWFAIECLSIFLGQTDHVQSGKPMSRAAHLNGPFVPSSMLRAACEPCANLARLWCCCLGAALFSVCSRECTMLTLCFHFVLCLIFLPCMFLSPCSSDGNQTCSNPRTL